jgi:hypothetical protein
MNTSRVFTLADVQLLSQCKKTTLNFDLSALDADDYDPFLDSLYRFIPDSILGLGFNSDLAIRESTLPPRSTDKYGGVSRVHPAVELESSALRIARLFLPRLIGVLSRVVPRSVSLQKLKFRSLPFTKEDFDVLAQSVAQCKSLRVLSFANVRMDNHIFARLARALRKRGVQTLKCRGCCLGDKIAPTLVSLIKAHDVIQKEADRRAQIEKNCHLGIVSLSVIDFRRNLFTDQFIEGVVDVVAHSVMRRIDLRENPEILGARPKSAKFMLTDLPVRPTPEERLAGLEEENKRLKDEISEMTGGRTVVALQSSLYAIGDRTPELVHHLDVLELLREKMEAEDEKLRLSPPPPRRRQSPRRWLKHKRVVVD